MRQVAKMGLENDGRRVANVGESGHSSRRDRTLVRLSDPAAITSDVDCAKREPLFRYGIAERQRRNRENAEPCSGDCHRSRLSTKRARCLEGIFGAIFANRHQAPYTIYR